MRRKAALLNWPARKIFPLNNTMQQLLPEWAPQEAILLAWPDDQTDWLPWLDEVRHTWLTLISQLNHNATAVIMLIRDDAIAACKQTIANFNADPTTEAPITKLLLLPADYNDTWLRDYGFLTTRRDAINQAVSFTFNGWGDKFDAQKDNRINADIFAELLQVPLQSTDFVLEGGALEINAEGTLLTTQCCLSNPARNGTWDEHKNRALLHEILGANKTIILQHGHLAGDDTDGHIDTLVRFTDDNQLVIQSCANRPNDSHFAALTQLVAECAAHFPHAKVFELPLPYITNASEVRLPASYANFLISNQCIFAPVYQAPEDQAALATLRRAFPQFKIVAINCRPLVQQFGSLHCITMQVPVGTLKPQVISLANSGIATYE